MELKYEVFGERTLLRKIDEKTITITEGGIILPNSAIEREEKNKTTFHAEVILIGTKVKLVEIGDIVIFNISGSGKIFLNNEEFYLVPELNLIGKVTK